MRLQDIIKREAPSAYIFESDGTVHRRQSLDDANEFAPEPSGDAAPVATGV
jgi:hypothetical protein